MVATLPRTSRDPWLSRFVHCETLTDNAAFLVVACIDATTQQRVFVVAADPRGPREASRVALDRLYAAHRDPPHEIIAVAIERGEHGEVPFVVFDFPARLDFDRVLQIGLDSGRKAPYAEADGFTTTLRDALLASGKRIDPETGHAVCLGTFAHANVLFAADGRHVLFGFGYNVVVYDALGRMVVRGRFFQAPEVAIGSVPTASSDIIALIEMTRPTLAFVNVHEALGRVLLGNTLREDLELSKLVLWYETRVTRSSPANRPPMDEIIATSNRIRALLGSVPNPAGFRKFVAAMLAEERPDLVAETPALEVANDGSFTLGEAHADLRKNKLLARLFLALVTARTAAPGRCLSVDELLEVGWPGEKMQREAGQNRVYVAIAALRRAGLGDNLERDDGGYRISAGLHVKRVLHP